MGQNYGLYVRTERCHVGVHHCQHLYFLLFRPKSNDEILRNCRYFVQIALVWISNDRTKIYHPDADSRSKAIPIHWLFHSKMFIVDIQIGECNKDKCACSTDIDSLICRFWIMLSHTSWCLEKLHEFSDELSHYVLVDIAIPASTIDNFLNIFCV